MIYAVNFKLSLGGANSQRRSTIGLHVRTNDAIEDDGWEGHITAWANALRGGLLPSTVIQGATLRRAATDGGGTVVKGPGRPFPFAIVGMRVAAAVAEGAQSAPDNVAILVKESTMYRNPVLKLRGALYNAEINTSGGRYIPAADSDILPDVTAAFLALRASITGSGGEVVVLHNNGQLPSVVTAFTAIGIADWDKTRRSISVESAEKALEKRKAKKFADELNDLNPTGAAINTLPAATQTQIQILKDQFVDFYQDAPAELKRYIFNLMPDWVKAIATFFGLAP